MASKAVVRYLPKQATEYFQYRWKRLNYWAKANSIGVVPKDAIGKDQDIVLKDWERETHEARHDRTRMWLSVAGATIGSLFFMCGYFIYTFYEQAEDSQSSNGVFECTVMGTIGAFVGASAGFFSHVTVPAIGAIIGIHQISTVLVNRRKSIAEARKAVERNQVEREQLAMYANYAGNMKEGEKPLSFNAWKNRFLDDDREPTDFEIAQLVLELRESSTALSDVTDMVDHLRRQNYTAGASAGKLVDHGVKLPGNSPVHSVGSFSINVDLLDEILES